MKDFDFDDFENEIINQLGDDKLINQLKDNN